MHASAKAVKGKAKYRRQNDGNDLRKGRCIARDRGGGVTSDGDHIGRVGRVSVDRSSYVYISTVMQGMEITMYLAEAARE